MDRFISTSITKAHTVILHLTYSDRKTAVKVQDEVVEVKPFQIIVWISVANDYLLEWDMRIPRLPAILDTGNNHNLAISAAQFARWTGIQTANMPKLQHMREKGTRVQLYAANVWLHTDTEPFQLKIDEGIGVYESDPPRLPILGLRALTNSKLQTLIHGDTKQVVIRTRPKWYWPF